MPDPLEKLETLYEEWARGDYSRTDLFAPDMKLESSSGMGDPIEADAKGAPKDLPLALHYTELLAFVKLERLAGEFAGNLSYGQQKLVEFVRVLMTDPELILLDESAAGVNRTLLNELLDAVRTLRDRGKTVLLVEHDMKVVMGLCETVFVLDHGEKLAEGAPGVIQADERVIEAYFGR